MDVTQSHNVNIATHKMNAEVGGLKTVAMNLRQQDNIILGLPNYKGTKPANTRTFSQALKLLFLLFFYT